MISREVFCKVINNLQNQDYYVQKLSDLANEYNRSVYYPDNFLKEPIIDLLEACFNIHDNLILRWVNETNYGETILVKNILDFKDSEELYEYIVKNYDDSKLLSFDQFCQAFNSLKVDCIFNEEFDTLNSKYGIDSFTVNPLADLIPIILTGYYELEYDDLISWWIWEKNFGSDFNTGDLIENGENIDLSTIDKLYNFLEEYCGNK